MAPETQEVKSPVAAPAVWAAGGVVNVVIERAQIVEFQGDLVPGMAFAPMEAIEFAEMLMRKAREAMEQATEAGE